jgi:hypothetical protein
VRPTLVNLATQLEAIARKLASVGLARSVSDLLEVAGQLRRLGAHGAADAPARPTRHDDLERAV